MNVLLNEGITFVLESFMSEGLTYEGGHYFIVYIAFSYW